MQEKSRALCGRIGFAVGCSQAPPFPGDGRVYIYNNTIFYSGASDPPMFQGGMANRTDSYYATNTISRNNILHVRSNTDDSLYDFVATNSSYDYDL